MEHVMQMKIVKGVTPIVLFLYLIIREFFFFSSKFSSSVLQQDQHHQVSFISQILVSAKPSYLVVFFTFNMIVVALLVGIYTQLSSFSSSSSSSSAEVSILSLIDDPYDGLKSTQDEDYEVYKDDFIPKIVYVEYKEEKAKSDDQSYDDYYCPSMEEIISTDDPQGQQGQDDDQEEQKDEVLMSYDDCHGYDHLEDMSHDEDIYSELDDYDFNKRVEEFIDENNKKWREELQNEKLIYGDRIISY